MNIVLFEPSEIGPPLPLLDPRSRHITKVLRRDLRDFFDVGLINGPRGKAQIVKMGNDGLHLEFNWDQPHPPDTVTKLAIGFPRPQTARDILRDATSIGVGELSFIRTNRSDPNYANSSLWSNGEWRRQTITGAAQAFDTFIPEVRRHEHLAETVERWIANGVKAVALDLYDCTLGLAQYLEINTANLPNAVLIGPERGWDDADRAILNTQRIPRLHLGPRVLRTETAVAVTLGLLHAAVARA
ncbi:MAG: 16S rRNA (uracil(1498)-N(3))-methyltransferase [Opitutaceae bacterium]|nr:16S rRNA (uracil(1498)-N(3))-methyltransferase [Opitutaceae bacterium]